MTLLVWYSYVVFWFNKSSLLKWICWFGQNEEEYWRDIIKANHGIFYHWRPMRNRGTLMVILSFQFLYLTLNWERIRFRYCCSLTANTWISMEVPVFYNNKAKGHCGNSSGRTGTLVWAWPHPLSARSCDDSAISHNNTSIAQITQLREAYQNVNSLVHK